MKFWDYHTHSELCNHAQGTIQEYIQAGINTGMTQIGISDHFPMQLLPEHFHIYAMSMNDLPKYLSEAKKLRSKYEDKIVVKVASEVDFFPKAFNGYKEIIKPFLDDFDYTIGSVHAVPWEGLEAIPIDEQQAISMIKEIGVDRAFLAYYNSVLKMNKTSFFQYPWAFGFTKKVSIIPARF